MDLPFVGRAEELCALRRWLEAARAGCPQLVLLHGGAGIGKSALLTAFVENLDAVHVVSATGDEGEVALQYGVLDLLLAQLPPVPVDARRSGTGRSASPRERDPFVEGANFLRRLDVAQRLAPVLLVLDDAHLADGQSLMAVTFALRRLRFGRTLTVLTSRPEESSRIPAGLDGLAAGTGSKIRLDGLSAAEVISLGEAVGFGRLSERAAVRLQEHTGGVPLHLRALMGDLTFEQVQSEASQLPAPRSFALHVLDGLARTTPSAQRLAAAAAVLGLRTPLQDAVAIAEVGDVLESVQELQAVRMIILAEHLHGWQLTFVHPLVRAAVYGNLGAATRARLHTLAADVRTGSEALRHRVAAAAGPDMNLVLALQQQAERDQQSGKWAQASAHLLAAVRLAEPGKNRDRDLANAVELLLIDGDLSAAAAHAGALAELPASAHRLQVQARVAWLSGQHDKAETLAQAAWKVAGPSEMTTRDGVAVMLAQMCILRDAGREAALWADRALSSGLLAAGLAGAARAIGAVGLALSGRAGDGLALLKNLPADPLRVGRDQLQELSARGILHLWTGDLDRAHADLQVSAPASGEGFPPYRLAALGYLAETEFRRGEWDLSAAFAEQAVALVEDTEQFWLTAFTHAVAIFVAAGRGQWDQAKDHLAATEQAAVSLGDRASRAYAGAAAVHLAFCEGDPHRLTAAADRLLCQPPDARQEPGTFGWTTQYVEALITLRRLEEASAFLGSLEETARQLGHRPRLAILARLRGQLAAAQRATAKARAAFDEALWLGEGSTEALEAGLIQAAYGRFLRRRGERNAAVDRLTLAEAIFEALEADPFLERCRAELAACGVPSTPHTSDQRLTPQEFAVARLVCAGRTNREVADELVLSVKTIGYHLSHVYMKLGVRSRTQLVARWSANDTRGRT